MKRGIFWDILFLIRKKFEPFIDEKSPHTFGLRHKMISTWYRPNIYLQGRYVRTALNPKFNAIR